jgi:hypothetical protein
VTGRKASVALWSRLLWLLGDEGGNDAPRLLEGLHHNYLVAGGADPAMERTGEAADWFSFADVTGGGGGGAAAGEAGLGAVGGGGGGGAYAPFVGIALRVLCAAPRKPTLSFSKTTFLNAQQSSQRRAVLRAFLSPNSVLTRHGGGASVRMCAVELVSLVQDVLAQRVRLPAFHLLNPREKQEVAELVDTCVALDLTFVREHGAYGPSTGVAAWRMEPDLSLLTEAFARAAPPVEYAAAAAAATISAAAAAGLVGAAASRAAAAFFASPGGPAASPARAGAGGHAFRSPTISSSSTAAGAAAAAAAALAVAAGTPAAGASSSPSIASSPSSTAALSDLWERRGRRREMSSQIKEMLAHEIEFERVRRQDARLQEQLREQLQREERIAARRAASSSSTLSSSSSSQLSSAAPAQQPSPPTYTPHQLLAAHQREAAAAIAAVAASKSQDAGTAATASTVKPESHSKAGSFLAEHARLKREKERKGAQGRPALWYKFNEGYTNAVRRPVYMRDFTV